MRFGGTTYHEARGQPRGIPAEPSGASMDDGALCPRCLLRGEGSTIGLRFARVLSVEFLQFVQTIPGKVNGTYSSLSGGNATGVGSSNSGSGSLHLL